MIIVTLIYSLCYPASKRKKCPLRHPVLPCSTHFLEGTPYEPVCQFLVKEIGFNMIAAEMTHLQSIFWTVTKVSKILGIFGYRTDTKFVMTPLRGPI